MLTVSEIARRLNAQEVNQLYLALSTRIHDSPHHLSRGRREHSLTQRNDPLFHRKRRIASELRDVLRSKRKLSPLEAKFIKQTVPSVVHKFGLGHIICEVLRDFESQSTWVRSAADDPQSCNFSVGLEEQVDNRSRSRSPVRQDRPVIHEEPLPCLDPGYRRVAYRFLTPGYDEEEDFLNDGLSSKTLVRDWAVTNNISNNALTQFMDIIHYTKGQFEYKSFPKLGKTLVAVSFLLFYSYFTGFFFTFLEEPTPSILFNCFRINISSDSSNKK